MAYTEMERWASQFQSNSRMLPKDKAKCIAKLARWQLKMVPDLDEAAIMKITSTAKQAIEYAPEWYRAWHVWAIVNYKFIGIYEKQNTRHPKIDSYLVPAISGFIKSISLAPYDNLQDLLRYVCKRKKNENAQEERRPLTTSYCSFFCLFCPAARSVIPDCSRCGSSMVQRRKWRQP